MKVLFISSAYPSGADDPRGYFIHQLARALVRAGADVTVLAPAAPAATARQALDGVDVRRADYWIRRWSTLASGFGGIVPNLRSRPWLAPQIPTLIAALSRHAVRLARDANLVHAHWMYPAGIAGAIAAGRARVPFIVTSHGTDLALAQRIRPVRWLCRRVCAPASACVAVSHGIAQGLGQIGVPSERVHIIPMGVDQGTGELRGTIHDSDDYLKFKRHAGLRVVFVGRLVPSKSVETLLSAHHELELRGRSVACALIGSGPSEKNLREQARSRDCRDVIFAGALPPESVRHWLAASHVLVLPSIREGRGIAILEAMAQGLPAVVSDIPGPRELVQNGVTGFLFPAGDAEGLADRLEALCEDEDLRREMGRRARAIIVTEGLTSDECARRHIALYEETLARWPSHGPPTGAAKRRADEPTP